MPSMNKALLIGHLGRDPELRTTQSGKSVCNFSLATSHKEHTEWHKLVCWNKLAELCSDILSKGDLVYVEGPIQTQEWTDGDGNKKETKQIVAMTVHFLRTKNGRKEADPEKVESVDPLDDSAIPF